jgi:hypothetical protein
MKIAASVSFPRKRESIVLTMGPRFRGDDADFHYFGWANRPWKLPRISRSSFQFPVSIFQFPFSNLEFRFSAL